MVVYVDVLLFINAVINYAVLATADRLLKRDVRLYRLLLGSFIGALFSLAIFLDPDSRILLFLLKVVSSAVLTLIAFGWKSGKEYLRAAAVTVAASLLYCGLFILFYQIFKPPNMLIVNDVVYLQVNPLMLLGLTALIYLVLLLLSRLLRERIKSTVVSLSFTVDDREYACVGKIDTGCSLVEPFSSAPVIIADKNVLTIDERLPHRIIPYTAVGGSSFLSAVRAGKVEIDRKSIDKTVYIAVADLHNGHYQAIINSDIIR